MKVLSPYTSFMKFVSNRESICDYIGIKYSIMIPEIEITGLRVERWKNRLILYDAYAGITVYIGDLNTFDFTIRSVESIEITSLIIVDYHATKSSIVNMISQTSPPLSEILSTMINNGTCSEGISKMDRFIRTCTLVEGERVLHKFTNVIEDEFMEDSIILTSLFESINISWIENRRTQVSHFFHTLPSSVQSAPSVDSCLSLPSFNGSDRDCHVHLPYQNPDLSIFTIMDLESLIEILENLTIIESKYNEIQNAVMVELARRLT